MISLLRGQTDAGEWPKVPCEWWSSCDDLLHKRQSIPSKHIKTRRGTSPEETNGTRNSPGLGGRCETSLRLATQTLGKSHKLLVRWFSGAHGNYERFASGDTDNKLLISGLVVQVSKLWVEDEPVVVGY